ncbi:hypothetical protein JCM5296_001394 [Sporobolomyces johnsonii]
MSNDPFQSLTNARSSRTDPTPTAAAPNRSSARRGQSCGANFPIEQRIISTEHLAQEKLAHLGDNLHPRTVNPLLAFHNLAFPVIDSLPDATIGPYKLHVNQFVLHCGSVAYDPSF